MGDINRIYASVGDDDGLVERLDAQADRYAMKRSQLVLLLVEHGVEVVERDGIDAVARDRPADAEEQPAD